MVAVAWADPIAAYEVYTDDGSGGSFESAKIEGKLAVQALRIKAGSGQLHLKYQDEPVQASTQANEHQHYDEEEGGQPASSLLDGFDFGVSHRHLISGDQSSCLAEVRALQSTVSALDPSPNIF